MHGKVKLKKNLLVYKQTIDGKTDWKPNMLLDDGGDLTAMMHNEYKDLLKK